MVSFQFLITSNRSKKNLQQVQKFKEKNKNKLSRWGSRLPPGKLYFLPSMSLLDYAGDSPSLLDWVKRAL